MQKRKAQRHQQKQRLAASKEQRGTNDEGAAHDAIRASTTEAESEGTDLIDEDEGNATEKIEGTRR